MSNIITAKNLSFAYPPQEGKLAIPVFENLNL